MWFTISNYGKYLYSEKNIPSEWGHALSQRVKNGLYHQEGTINDEKLEKYVIFLKTVVIIIKSLTNLAKTTIFHKQNNG